jgi:zona occludens toxin
VITLLTGVPGSGKTLNAIRMVDKEWGESNRDIYYRGIRELSADLGWTEISDSDLQNWWTFPDGSIFVIDEVQQVWPRRSPNHPAPEAVSRLDTHRHRGFDFYIISQKPKNFDFEIRGYVGRHLHFERGYGREGTRQLEWQTACDDPDDYHRRQEANVTRIKFDKSYYSKYHSAEVHTFKKRIPKQFYVFGGAVFLTLFAFGFAFNNIMSRMDEPQSAQSVNPLTDQTNSDSGLFSGLPTGSPNREQVKTTEEYLAERVPRIEGMDWSAPIYDGVIEVKTWPRPQCIRSERTLQCKCYTQQATPLDVPQELCDSVVDGGFFDHTREERGEWARVQAQPPAPIAPSPPVTPSSPQVIFIGSPEAQAQRRWQEQYPGAEFPIQPGSAYRNPGRTVPTQPLMPGVGSRPYNQQPIGIRGGKAG